MSKSEFLKILKNEIQQVLNDKDTKSQLDYYERYISSEVKNGRTEKDVIEELGDPRLIAKTITTVNKVGSIGSNDNSQNNTTYNETSDSSSTTNTKNRGKIYQPYISNDGIIGCTIILLVLLILVIGALRFLGILAYGVGTLLFSWPIGFLLVIAILFLILGIGKR